MDRLRILLCSWAPFHAGAEVAAERLAVGLRDDGHCVTVVVGTQGETLNRMRSHALDARYVPLAVTDKFRWWQYRRAQRDLQRIMQEVQPDIVHANDLPSSQMVSQAAGQLGIPRVCHHRWLFEEPAINWLNKYGAERHCFVSHALMDALCAASPRLAASPGSVVYDGLPLPPPPAAADRLAARSELGLPRDKVIALFAGQIIERKGIADLLRAWKILAESWHARAELVIVGDDLQNDGQHRRQMECLAAEISCPAKFVGFRSNVDRWLTAADLCVVPSHVEPLGNATLEAMAHGLPVIGSCVGGIPEMIVNGDTGILVPPRSPTELAAAIQALLRDCKQRARVGAAARARCAEKFSLRAHVDATLAEYEQILVTPAAVIG